MCNRYASPEAGDIERYGHVGRLVRLAPADRFSAGAVAAAQAAGG
jgi:hypothetical protein